MNKIQYKFPKKKMFAKNNFTKKSQQTPDNAGKCGNVVTTRIEQVRVNWNNTFTNAPRKMSENIFFENFQNGRQVNSGQKCLKTKKKFLH